MRHRTIDVGGPVSVLELGGDGAPIVLVHGLDGSAANWVDARAFTAAGGLVAPDLPGFGRTPLAGRSSRMTDAADLVAGVVRELSGGPATLVGNSMGAVVALLAAARHPSLCSGVVLVAPAVPRSGPGAFDATLAPLLLPYLVPGLAGVEPRRRAAQPPAARVRGLLDLCFAPGNLESRTAFDEMVAVAEQRDPADARRAWVAASRSLFGWLVRRGAFHRVADAVEAPVLVVEGGADPVIPTTSIAALLARHPGWEHVRLDGVGHVPQLEDPAGFVAAASGWIAARASPSWS